MTTFTNEPHFCSGYGQFHTNEPDPSKPTKKLTAYLAIGRAVISRMVDKPQQVSKDKAQWLIPSTLPSRNAEDQKQHGLYYALTVDLDKQPPAVQQVAEIIDMQLGHVNYEIYNTASATKDNQKCRVIIWLDKPLGFVEWNICQQILNDRLEQLGIMPDRALEKAAQLVYLPNRGAVYQTASRREGKNFNPMAAWDYEIDEKKDEAQAAQDALIKTKTLAKNKRAASNLTDTQDLIMAFNAKYTPIDIVLKAGYDIKGDTTRHPDSEGGNYSASVKADANGVLRIKALSPNDPLYVEEGGAHDSFSAYTVLFHGGDHDAALRAAGDEMLTIGHLSFNKAKQTEHMQAKAEQDLLNSFDAVTSIEMPSSFNETLDNSSGYCKVDLLKHLDDDHALKAYSIQIAKATDLPVNTVFLAGLATYSAMASRNHVVQYPNGDGLPIGIYTLIEQPSGTGKSNCLNKFQQPFYDEQKRLLQRNKKLIADLTANNPAQNDEAKLSKEDIDVRLVELKKKQDHLTKGLYVTNATPEGLEKTLMDTWGYFSAASSEQGLCNSLLGNSYGNDSKANNNDTLLNGFDGGFVNSIRVTRKGYTGNVVGSVICFAQSGTIETVLKASNGTGLSERFLMLAEPHSLGKRDHKRKRVSVTPFDEINYENACKRLFSVITDPLPLDRLDALHIRDTGFDLINDYRNKLEPDLIDGGKFSHISLRGAASKVNMQIMKIAANLFLLDNVDSETVIPDKHIKAAIHIANDLLEANLKLCQDKGILGVKAEFTSILSLFENDQRPRTERNIIQSKAQKLPFKDFSGSKSGLIRETLIEMVKQRLLTVVLLVGVTNYMQAQ